MDKVEIKVIKTCWTYLLEELDPLLTALVDELYERNVLNEDQMRDIRLQRSRKAQLRTLLPIVQNNSDFDTFLDVLNRCDYEHVVAKLKKEKQEIMGIFGEQLPDPVCKIGEKSDERKASKISHELMCVLHRGQDGQYSELTKKLKDKFKENYDVLYAVQDSMLSYCITRYQNKDFDGEKISDRVFRKLNKYKDKCANPVATTLWYLTRRSVFLSLRGDYTKAMDTMNDGLSKLDRLECSRSTEFSFISQVYALHMMWEGVIMNPFSNKPETVREVVNRMDYSLEKGIGHAMQSENDKHKFFHLRLLYLRWAFVRLGMNISGEVKLIRHPTEHEVKEAGEYLDQVDKYWDGIECRREMFYYMARTVFWRHKARLGSISPAKAKHFADLAMQKADEGNFKKQKLAISNHLNELEEILEETHNNSDSDSDLEDLFPKASRKTKSTCFFLFFLQYTWYTHF